MRGKIKMVKKNITGYPSIDRIHLEGLKYFEKHPFIPNLSISNAIDWIFRFKSDMPVFECLGIEVTRKQFRKDACLQR